MSVWSHESEPQAVTLKVGKNTVEKRCYFCDAPSSDHQICSSPECHEKAGAILRADLDYHAALWPNAPAGHEDITRRSRLATNIATLAAIALIAGIIILTIPLIVFPLTEAR
jgi:hypothetical protein